ncbi:photosynthetic reaction center cytochrome PufC [Maritimibacter sp. UBA3975]|uniref:photosynthetic reaction center cytochrome PufC n=1 Tax=Maritimibacter sp. UBA3975 TaxID=1946833 RepID=UPI000C0A128E|nr:photosynthetic reaction center cytochrome PufC [Maritimibacter sp. UBA3975]MAM62921.1 photosynthetic reaction center cytochrome c subunit [Maritimibacter sp.]|tara:strand:+ start:1881 stop:2999 length:1119 start_codon:yes stop_codon:yes gene_type:complete
MFDWYSKWNRENPIDVERPVFIFGAVGVFVIAATALVVLGQPFKTDGLQTGPRGTGMAVVKFESTLATPDPGAADLFEDPPFVPEGGEDLARDIYDNVEVLGDLTEDNFNRVMAAMTRWVAPEQGCAYCHGDVDLEDYGNDDLYTKVVSRRMLEMTQNINENWDIHVNANKEVGVTCYTCHRGENVPSDIWFLETPTVMAASGWSANQNAVTPLSTYTSLPSDALEAYLLNYETIAVHDLESRVAGVPGQDGYPAIQNAERTYAFMNYIANSLGVNCTLCHNTRAFYDGVQVTPQWNTASLGIAMVQELNEEYLLPLKDLLPEERLGDHGDAPKAACATCHKGQQQPLRGANVIGDWPELAASGAPDYTAAD